jgi:hypothetical protein
LAVKLFHDWSDVGINTSTLAAMRYRELEYLPIPFAYLGKASVPALLLKIRRLQCQRDEHHEPIE